MKKLIFLLLVFAGFMACENESIQELPQETSVTEDMNARMGDKIDVCHYDAENDSWHVINISANAWKGHEKHGDVMLVDADGDGWVANANECVPGGDCDDDDPNVNPGVEEICGDGIDNNCDGQIDEDCFPTGCWGEEFSAKFIADVALDGLGDGYYVEDCGTSSTRIIGLMTNDCGNGSYFIVIYVDNNIAYCDVSQWVDNVFEIIASTVISNNEGVELFDALYDFGIANNFDDSNNCDFVGYFGSCPGNTRVNQDELLEGEGVITVEDFLRLKK